MDIYIFFVLIGSVFNLTRPNGTKNLFYRKGQPITKASKVNLLVSFKNKYLANFLTDFSRFLMG